MTSAKTEAQPDKSTGGYPLFNLYTEMERRLKARGSYTNPKTLEKCYSLLLVMLQKKRPMKPNKIVDILLFDPAYAKLSDARRMAFYELEQLQKIEMVKTVAKGEKSLYEIAEEVMPTLKTSEPRELTQITDPRIKPVLASWNRIRKLRGITRQWDITSLAHPIVFEFSTLLRYNDRLAEESNEEGRMRLETIEYEILRLMEVYTAYPVVGLLPEGEAELFNSCEEKILKFCKSIWWDYDGAASA